MWNSVAKQSEKQENIVYYRLEKVQLFLPVQKFLFLISSSIFLVSLLLFSGILYHPWSDQLSSCTSLTPHTDASLASLSQSSLVSYGRHLRILNFQSFLGILRTQRITKSTSLPRDRLNLSHSCTQPPGISGGSD